jgi:hypothetical protein
MVLHSLDHSTRFGRMGRVKARRQATGAAGLALRRAVRPRAQ